MKLTAISLFLAGSIAICSGMVIKPTTHLQINKKATPPIVSRPSVSRLLSLRKQLQQTRLISPVCQSSADNGNNDCIESVLAQSASKQPTSLTLALVDRIQLQDKFNVTFRKLIKTTDLLTASLENPAAFQKAARLFGTFS